METVRIRISNPTESGQRRGWTKHVTAVDNTKTNGYAFGGDFLRDNAETDLPVGAILIQVAPCGSAKRGWQEAEAFRVEADGSFTVIAGPAHWRNDFLSFRDAVKEALEDMQSADPVVLKDALLAEREQLVGRIAEIDNILAKEKEAQRN